MKRYIYTVLLYFILVQFSYSKEVLMDKPIDLTPKESCSIESYCKKYINDIEIEKFIRQEFQKEFIVVSLDKCIDIALNNNYKIDISNHVYKASKYNLENKYASFLPRFYSKSYITKYDGQFLVGNAMIDELNETVVSINLTVDHLLFEGGKQIFEMKASKNIKKSKYHNLNFQKVSTIYQTSKLYYELLLAKLRIEIYLRNLIECNAQLTLSENQKNAGFGTNFDIIRSKNESTSAKIALIQALNNFRISQTKLCNVMGIELDTYIIPYEKDVKMLEIFDNSISDYEKFSLAIKNREDLKEFKELINFEKNTKNIIKTEFFPKPHVLFIEQLQGTFNHDLKNNYVLSFYFDWFFGENTIIGTTTKLKEQTEKIRAKILELQNKLREIQEQIISSTSKVQFTKREVALAKDNLNYAQESVKLAMIRFNYGKGTYLDIITAQTQVTLARLNYVTSIINYNLAQLEISYSCGVLCKKVVFDNY